MTPFLPQVYLTQAVPLAITLLVLGLPVATLLTFSCASLRNYKTYTKDRSAGREAQILD